MIETRRKIEKDDWPLIKLMLSERYCRKETKRRIAYFQKLNQLEDCSVTVGLIGFNIVSLCIRKNDQEIEKLITRDWEL